MFAIEYPSSPVGLPDNCVVCTLYYIVCNAVKRNVAVEHTNNKCANVRGGLQDAAR